LWLRVPPCWPHAQAGRSMPPHQNRIRNSGAFDAVIDFERAVRDKTDPSGIAEAYDSGDKLHPSDAGYAAMANAIDLKLFSGAL
jgi:lysophospholipase L1-like esterase